MSMANREELDAVSHDTFPGPGPLRSDEGRTNIRPVEQMVDAAIDRIEREYAAAHGVNPGESLAVATQEKNLGLTRRSSGGRLRWKGLDVSEEFRRYAERVARGEDLPPFEGKILAEPDAVFPWEPGQRAATPRRPLRRQLGAWGGAVLLLGGVAWSIFGALHTLDNDPLHRGESPLGTAVFSNRASDTTEPSKGLEGLSKSTGPLDQIAAATDTVGTTEPSGASIGTAEAAHDAVALADQPGTALEDGKPGAALAAPAVTKRLLPQPAAPNPAAPHAVITLSAPVAPVSHPPVVASAVAASGAPNPLTIPHLEVPGAQVQGAVSNHAPSSGTLGNINANAVASNSVPSATQSDPKKEPGREASAMGALLVETPSF
jgi:hypothetical protein